MPTETRTFDGPVDIRCLLQTIRYMGLNYMTGERADWRKGHETTEHVRVTFGSPAA